MSVLDDIIQIVLDNTKLEEAFIESDTRRWIHGSLQQRDRIAAAASYAAQHWQGDFVEIGCLHGGTTQCLAQVARQYKRRILCIDPWPSKCPLTGTDYGADPLAMFKSNMVKWLDLLDIMRLESQHPQAVAAIKQRDVCFAFVDGMHTYDCAIVDIRSVAHAKVICVDDVLWETGVMKAMNDGAKELGRKVYHNRLCREGWIA